VEADRVVSNRSLLGKNRWNCRCSQESIPHNRVDLPPLVSLDATGACIPIGNSEILLAAVYNSPWRNRSDADITEPFSFRNKCILAGDLNAKHPFWNSAVSNSSDEKLLQMFDIN
jgi:hypothetical protein